MLKAFMWRFVYPVLDRLSDMWDDLPAGPESESARAARVQAGHDAKFATILAAVDAKVAEGACAPTTEGEASVAEEERFVYCAACQNIDPTKVTGIEYAHGHLQRYDGVSEWDCKVCGARTGRWTRQILQEGESEPRYGRKT